MTHSGYDVVAEQVVIASALTDDAHRAEALSVLRAVDFQGPRHQVIWRSVERCVGDGVYIDVQSVAASAEGDFGGFEYLKHLFALGTSNDELRQAMFRIKEDSLRMRARNELAQYGGLLADRTVTYSDCLFELDAIRARLGSLPSAGGYEDHGSKYLAQLAARRTDGGSVFVPTGIDALDGYLTEGFAPGSTTLVAGRTRIGKTFLLVDLLMRQLKRQTPPRVLFVACEKDVSYISSMMISNATGIELYRLLKYPQHLSVEEIAEIEWAAKRFVSSPYLRLIDSPFKDVEASHRGGNDALNARMKELLSESEYDIAFWDLLERGFTDRSPQAIKRALVRHQEYSMATGTHNVISHQLSRGSEDRTKVKSRRPQLTDLKDSGGWEEVMDLVLLIHREKVYKPFMPKDDMEIVIAKQKMGADGIKIMAPFLPWCCAIGRSRVSGGDDSDRSVGLVDEA